jgi:hypothetical protein
MSAYVKLVTDAGDQYLSTLAEMQEKFLKAANEFSTRMASVAPPIEVPPALTAGIPTPQEVTDASFAFAQKLLKQQKAFSEKLLAAGTSATK